MNSRWFVKQENELVKFDTTKCVTLDSGRRVCIDIPGRKQLYIDEYVLRSPQEI